LPSTLRTLRTLLPLALLFAAHPLAAQSLKVGDLAPDFTVTTVTAKGADTAPFTLSAHRGETVVLAFFPQAGTPGCTTQMEAYRDRYATLFKGGQQVTLVGVSTDDAADLTGWARKKSFPFRFATDGNKAVGKSDGRQRHALAQAAPVRDRPAGAHCLHRAAVQPDVRNRV
jgi:peroxiredoxin Q/BCP